MVVIVTGLMCHLAEIKKTGEAAKVLQKDFGLALGTGMRTHPLFFKSKYCKKVLSVFGREGSAVVF